MIRYKVEFVHMDWESPIKGVRCKTCHQLNKRIRLVEYTKEMPEHWCEKGHYGLVLEGELEIQYPDQKVEYRQGDGIFIPDGAEHAHKGRVLSDSVMVIFVEDV